MTPLPLASIVTVVASESTDRPALLAAAGMTTRQELYNNASLAAPEDGLRRFDGIAVVLLEAAVDAVSRVYVTTFRAETTDAPVPLLWLVPTAAEIPAALEAGADAAMLSDAPPEHVIAQVRALIRTWEQSVRLGSRGIDVRTANERLRKIFTQADLEAALARRIVAGCLRCDVPKDSDVRVGLSHRRASHGTVSLHDISQSDDGKLSVMLLDLAGMGPVTGTLTAGLVLATVLREQLAAKHDSAKTLSPAGVLNELNRRLLELPLPEAAVVSALVAQIDPKLGKALVACAGMPAPVLVPAAGPASVWHGSGPFLGITESTFEEISGQIQPGEKLLLLGGTEAAEQRVDVREAASEIAAPDIQAYADQLADKALGDSSGYTLVAIQRVGS